MSFRFEAHVLFFLNFRGKADKIYSTNRLKIYSSEKTPGHKTFIVDVAFIRSLKGPK